MPHLPHLPQLPTRLSTTVAILALAGLTTSAAAQQGVRSKAPRRDAGENALRMLEESRANRQTNRNTGRDNDRDRPPLVGPSPIAPGYSGGYGVRYPYAPYSPGYGSGVTIHGDFGDVQGTINLGGGLGAGHLVPHGFGHKVVYVNRIPYACYNGGYYRYGRGYYDGPNRRQVVQSPTVIVIDRTGVSTNEVNPAEPITLDESLRVSPKELGQRALFAGEAGQAVELLTEHVLANEGDRAAERLLGVALVLDGQTELGIALFARAYNGDPELAFRPLTRDTIDSLSAWRRVQRDIQRTAGVQRTASSWLAAIAITQDELPHRTHADRLEQAKRAGLSVDVADAFQRWLEGGEPIRKPQPAAQEPTNPKPAEPAEPTSPADPQ